MPVMVQHGKWMDGMAYDEIGGGMRKPKSAVKWYGSDVHQPRVKSSAVEEIYVEEAVREKEVEEVNISRDYPNSSNNTTQAEDKAPLASARKGQARGVTDYRVTP